MTTTVRPHFWSVLANRSNSKPLATEHISVMPEEALAALALRPGEVAVDGTLGHGGHSLRMSQAIGAEGTLVATDWDTAILAIGAETLREAPGRVMLHHADFREIPSILKEAGLGADGILLDLGLNSAQVDDPERGFSFLREGPLDMRMDRTRGEPASALLNRASANELERIFWEYGDERWARRIAQVIVERRKTQPLRTTQDLVDAVLAAVPAGAREKRIHPATRVFQAIRLATTKELDRLQEALEAIAATLNPGGRMVVISFHSGEDRCVKNAFRDLAKQGYAEMWKKPMLPTAAEIARNSRSRSAKMRGLIRLSQPGETS